MFLMLGLDYHIETWNVETRWRTFHGTELRQLLCLKIPLHEWINHGTKPLEIK